MSYYARKDIKTIMAKDLIWVTVQILVGIISVISIYFFIPVLSTEYGLYITAKLGVIVLFTSIITWYGINREIFSAYILFFLAFYMFSFGQSFLTGMNINLSGYHLFKEFSEEQMLDAQIFTLMCLIGFHLGALIHSIKIKTKIRENKFTIKSGFTQDKIKKSMRLIGWILVLISGPVAWYFNIKLAINSIQYGYVAAAYNMNIGHTGLTRLISGFYIPGMVMLLLTYQKKWQKIFLSILVLYGGVQLIIGTRTVFVSIILSSLWVYHKIIKPIKFKSLVQILVIGSFLLLIVVGTSNYRDSSDKSLKGYKESLVDALEENPVKEVIQEFGASMRPLILTQSIMKEDMRLRYGESYIYATLSLIPESIVGGITGNHKLFSEKAGLAEWLMKKMSMDYGPGFSLVAESYYNFGNVGFIIMIIVGYLIVGILPPLPASMLENNILKLYIMVVFLMMMFTLSREQSLEFIFEGFRYIFLPCLAIKIGIKVKTDKIYSLLNIG